MPSKKEDSTRIPSALSWHDALTPKMESNDKFVVGAVKEEDFGRCVQFLVDYFMPREPMGKGVHLAMGEFEASLRQKTLVLMSSGASTYAVHKPSGEIAGVMANQILTRDQSAVYADMGQEESHPSIKHFLAILKELEASVNLFEDPKVNKVVELAFTAVHPDFAGNKLTVRMTEECERLAAGLGCQMVTCQSTNQITQHIRKKMGFQVRHTFDFALFEVGGKKVVDVGAMGGTTVAIVFTKYL